MTLTLASNGDLVQHSHYQPYGDAANIQPSRVQPYGFSGKERDDSGLMYFEARYYDPVSGRFISPDPLFAEQMDKCLGLVIECNLYQYTGNNPVMYVDPDGRTLKKLGEVFGKISSKYKNLQCAECATEMLEAAQKEGISGKVVAGSGKYETRAGVWSDKARKQISENKNHYGVEVDGKVFDNKTPEGISRNDFENDLFHASSPDGRLDYKDINFGPDTGYGKAKDFLKSVLGSVAAVGVAVSSVISEEAEAAINNPAQAVYDWTPLSDIGAVLSMPGSTPRNVEEGGNEN